MSTLPERYSIATSGTGSLGPASDAIDVLIATGWLAQRSTGLLGAALGRLRSEVDVVRAHAGKSSPTPELLLQLRSLRAVRTQVLALATVRATRHNVRPDKAPALVDRVLDVFLDPTCKPCDGRGFIGGDGLAKRMSCRACGKTGLRRAGIGSTAGERDLAFALLDAMDAAARFAGTGLRRIME